MRNKLISIILAAAIICSSFVVFANADSKMLGDINEDGEITASDARTVLRVSAEMETLPEEKLVYADVNFDGEITASDARAILRASAEIEALPGMPAQDPETETTTNEPETTTEPETETTTKEPETETTTAPETTTEEEETVVIAEEYPDAIDAFLKGKFFLEATMGTGAEATPLKMAMSDKGYEFSATVEFAAGFDPMEFSIMQLSKTLYIKYSDASGKKKYFALDEETAKSAKELFGFDISEIFSDEAFAQINFGQIENPGKPVYTTGEYNGETHDIYTFGVEGSKVAFYAIGDDVKRIVFLNEDGTIDSYINVIQLTKRIPGKMLSTQGCQEAEILEFIADLMAFFPES